MHNDDIKQYFFNPISKLGMAMNEYNLYWKTISRAYNYIKNIKFRKICKYDQNFHKRIKSNSKYTFFKLKWKLSA